MFLETYFWPSNSAPSYPNAQSQYSTVLSTSVGVAGWPSGVIFDMCVLAIEDCDLLILRKVGSTLNKGPWRTQRALSCRAGERTEVRQPIRNERVDEVSIIVAPCVALLDFLHGAIMLVLQLATL